MKIRTKNLLKLHRLWDEPTSSGMSLFADGQGDLGAGGGDDGGGEGGGAAGGTAGTGGDAGASGGTGGQGSGSSAGGTKPSDEEARLLKDLMRQKKAREEAEGRLKELDGKLKEFEGIDPAKVRTLLAQQEEEERRRMEAKGEYDRILKQMADQHAAELKRLKDEKDSVERGTGALQQQIADLTVGSAFSASQFVKDDLTLTPTKARVIYGSHFEFKDGKVVGYDKPAGSSDRTPLVNSQGETLSFDEALKKIIETDPEKDHLIRSKTKPGAGSGTSKAKGMQDNKPVTSIAKIANGLKALAKNQ